MAIRIKCTDKHGNVAYVHNGGGSWRCTLANGIPAAFSYAGVRSDEMACQFDLEDCSTPEEALAVVQKHGSHTYKYEVYGGK
jgi:hypothetical protein